VMAVARKDFDPAALDPGADLLPLATGLELLALVGIVDPPRPTARASIATARAAGIRIRMITGDYAVTAAATARELGIDGTAISGAEFGAMSDEEALAKIDDVGVIARVSPQHKVRLIDVLRKNGQIVAMTGDGVNDAPAVKKADIGIAMGITGDGRGAPAGHVSPAPPRGDGAGQAEPPHGLPGVAGRPRSRGPRRPAGTRPHGHRPLFRAPCQPGRAGQRADTRPPARRGMGHHLAARPRGRPRRAADTNRRPAAPS